MLKVSVIVPTYGEPSLLGKAIDSVISQSTRDFELIIVDDNDPGTINRIQTEKIVKAAMVSDSRIIYLKHKRNMNGAVARNTGIKRAKGEYIAFLDADDEFVFNRLEKCIKALENSSDKYAGVYTGCEYRRNGKVYNIQLGVPSGNFLVDTLACCFMFCTGSNIFMKAEVVKALGFDSDFLRHQDYEFLVRYFKIYDLIGLNEILVIKNNDNRNLPKPSKIALIKEKFLNKYAIEISKLDSITQNRIYSEQYISIAEAYAAVGQGSEAYKYYIKAKKLLDIRIQKKLKLLLKYLLSIIRNR